MVIINKTAVIIGGGRGIGKATAIALANKGFNVVIASRNESEINEIYRKIGKKGIPIAMDIKNEKEICSFVKKTIDKFGKIDILVNSAGMHLKKPFEKVSLNEWDDVFNTNIRGQFLTIKEFLPHMKKGTIINISSCMGLYGFPFYSVYCASKFAVIGLTKSLAKELKNKSIKLYAICPGAVDTSMHKKDYPDYPTWKLIKPERIAKIIVNLCKPNCSKKSGSVIEVYSVNELYGLLKLLW